MLVYCKVLNKIHFSLVATGCCRHLPYCLYTICMAHPLRWLKPEHTLKYSGMESQTHKLKSFWQSYADSRYSLACKFENLSVCRSKSFFIPSTNRNSLSRERTYAFEGKVLSQDEIGGVFSGSDVVQCLIGGVL